MSRSAWPIHQPGTASRTLCAYMTSRDPHRSSWRTAFTSISSEMAGAKRRFGPPSPPTRSTLCRAQPSAAVPSTLGRAASASAGPPRRPSWPLAALRGQAALAKQHLRRPPRRRRPRHRHPFRRPRHRHPIRRPRLACVRNRTGSATTTGGVAPSKMIAAAPVHRAWPGGWITPAARGMAGSAFPTGLHRRRPLLRRRHLGARTIQPTSTFGAARVGKGMHAVVATLASPRQSASPSSSTRAQKRAPM